MSALMLDGDYDKWIIKMISDATGWHPDQILINSRLNHDLGIDGDAAELLTEYAEAFAVDMSEFQFPRYFRNEPHLLNFWRWIPGQGSKLMPITVRNLVEAAKRKKWKNEEGR